MLLTKEERQGHLNLEESCIEIGTGSGECRALLAHFLGTTAESKGTKTHLLCHACHNHSCSNPRHLYWGTARENSRDAHQADPLIGKRISQILLSRNPNHYKEMGSKSAKGWIDGKPWNKKTKKEWEARFKQVEEASIDVNSYGWVSRVSRLWGLSHSQVKRIFDLHYDKPVYRRKSGV